jgi:hypothetical protein
MVERELAIIVGLLLRLGSGRELSSNADRVKSRSKHEVVNCRASHNRSLLASKWIARFWRPSRLQEFSLLRVLDPFAAAEISATMLPLHKVDRVSLGACRASFQIGSVLATA